MNIRLRRRLRFRLAIVFAVFGTLLTSLLAAGVFVAAQQASDRLMDETLRSELEDYVARRGRNPASLPPATVSIRGYVFAPAGERGEVPAAVAALAPGRHQLRLDGLPYRVAVEDVGAMRYVMMFNETAQRHREEEFVGVLLSGTLVMALLSASLGWWLAGRMVAPVAELARLIGSDRPEQAHREAEFSDDEIGKLASGVFGEYVKRISAFISREQSFTTDVSHELRTPLSIARGVVELMENDERLDAQQRERIERIHRAVNNMSDITSALLLMAREERQPALAAPCDVCTAVGEALESHRHLASPRTEVRFACIGHPRLLVENTLLRIVVANLLRNAFAYTDAGTVEIAVTDDGVAVTDTGRGIPDAEIDKVFRKHYKGSGSEGSGIGLSLVKRICDRYGWEIAIESAIGHGTCATLRFRPPDDVND